MRRSLPALVALALCAALGTLAGCQAAHRLTSTVTIPHPTTTPLIPAATQINAVDPSAENAIRVRSGALVDRAALTRVDEREVCVQIAHWAAPRDLGRRDLARFDFALVAADEDGEPRRRERPSRADVGQWQVEHTGLPSWFTGWRPTRIPVAFAASDLCFANDGLVTAATRELALVTHLGAQERRYRWRLDPGASYPAGADASVAIHPPPHDPADVGMGQPVAAYPPAQAGMGPSGGLEAVPYGGEQIPGGHPVDLEQVRALLEGRFELLRQCLSRTAEREPELLRRDGMMIAELTIGPSGVGNVRVVQNDFTPGAAVCMQQHLEALPVPPDPMRWTGLFRYGVTNRRAGAP